MKAQGVFGTHSRGGARIVARTRSVVVSALLSFALSTPVAAFDRAILSAPGASPELTEALQASSLLLTAQAEGRTGPVDIMAAARAEYGRLIGLLYEHGYFAPTINVRVDGREAAQISPLSNPAAIDVAEVTVTLGPLFTFAQAQITPLAGGTTLPQGFAVGAPARSTLIREALRAALDGWRAQGHAQAAAAGQEVVANHETHTLSVRLRIDPGAQLLFGEVVAEGLERTRPARLRAIADLPQGAVHDPARIEDATQRLRRTGAFTSVVIEPAERANPDGSIDTVVTVTEAPPRRIGFGAEIDSDSGGTLSGFWLNRNLFGGAERLRLEASVEGIAAQVGGLGFALDAHYIRPATTRSTADLDVRLRVARQNELDFDADVLEFDAGLVRRHGARLSSRLGIALRAEDSDYGPLRATNARFSTLGFVAGLDYDSRDVATNATRGVFGSFSLMPYAGFGSAASGLRATFDARGYNDLGTDGWIVLAGRVQGGAVMGSALADTPLGYRFYSGGGGTVRGLPYQSLGTTSGLVSTGGLGYAAASGEVRVRANDSLSVVGFVDAGRVSAGAFGGAADWHAGAGFGVRYDTPVGPLRLDLATPLRRNATAVGSRSVQVYLGIGQAF